MGISVLHALEVNSKALGMHRLMLSTGNRGMKNSAYSCGNSGSNSIQRGRSNKTVSATHNDAVH